ncbi:hypothetical protein [Jannaschia sp. R86511]|uniref:hypothetical protein n=1 Tax=Jannaschia sp. R86511 TaxID=3093853 RepID=UPI0036D21AEE
MSTGAATASFAAYGCDPVTVSGESALLAELSRLWAPFLSPGAGAEPPVPVPDLATAAAEVNRALVARTPYPAVHAGVVATGSGAVVVPAVSGAGKSTMTAALCLAGALYLSDEALVLDDADPRAPVALAYPKPVALSPWSAAALGLGSTAAPTGDLLADGSRELLFAPAVLGEVSGPVPVAHLLLPERVTGAPSLQPLRRMEGLAALVRLSFNHYVDPRRFLLVAAAAVTGAQVWRVQVGDPAATARVVLDTLG